MKKFLRRLQPISAIVISALVLLLCVVGIVGVWIIQGVISSTVVQLLDTVDQTAQIIRDGITKVDTKVEALEEFTTSLEAASAQISQNVDDQGLILTLLPETKEQELVDAAESVRESIMTIIDFLNTTKEIIEAVNKMPFIELPVDDLAGVGGPQERVEAMMTRVDELKVRIGEFRSKTAENLSKITDAISNVNSGLTELRSGLATADADLSLVQTKARQLQELLPKVLILSAIVATLLAIWVGYSQIVVIGRARQHLRDIRSEEAANEPAELEESAKDEDDEMESTTNEEAGSNDTPQT